ncbi:hypothetical protein QBC47DRAFT_326984 [Echria macrotheca]|uniref:Uncharacterized protein n=1 Tax=Echria macrotheca TaxID=438768 RepID=A0AAJ0B7E8_9PEZI|nr:hypothetical protein QBC47DRAFT_326984 [Echria macrotheca]
MRGARVITWECVERLRWLDPPLLPLHAIRAQSTCNSPISRRTTTKKPHVKSAEEGSTFRFKRVSVPSRDGDNATSEKPVSQKKLEAISKAEVRFGETQGIWGSAKALRRFYTNFNKHEPTARRILAELHSASEDGARQVARRGFRDFLMHRRRAARETGSAAYFGDDWLEGNSPSRDDNAELDHWAWILSANPDTAIERFISDDRPKPIFLLLMLVGRDQVIREPQIFVSLLQYIFKHHLDIPPTSQDQRSFQLTWMHFVVLLNRLASNCLESWPKLLPSVSRLAVVFIERMPAKLEGSQAHAQAMRSEVFNHALRIFAKPPAINPLDDMEFNWEAQKIMLVLSSRLQPSLYVTRDGYRSIRRVLAALPKSVQEKEVSQRASKTWPPYRRDWDGRDERRRPEDNLSRVVRAGVLQREAGYARDPVDRALDILGGSGTGMSPSIQTRALLPVVWTEEKANLNIFTEWSARIIATRNAREAWREFNEPPQSGLKPNAIIYAEMFQKLFAREVHDASVVPGDGKEVFPVYDGNLSPFEIARITPPEPKDLYQMMLLSGLRPTGSCLGVLLKNSETKEEALRYLQDSPFKAVAPMLREGSFDRPDCATLLPELPLSILYAWIRMLCRTHARQPGHATGAASNVSKHIEEAVRLASAYHKHNPVVSETDRVPSYLILDALANDKVLYSSHGPHYNISGTLSVFMKVWQQLVRLKGVDEKLFEQLCKIARKSLRLTTFKDTETGQVHMGGEWADDRLLKSREHQFLQVYIWLKETFDMLNAPVREFSVAGDDPLTTAHKITAAHVYHYMRALGVIGDWREMVRLMHWIYDAWDQDGLLRAARNPGDVGYNHITRTFSYFASVGQRVVDPETFLALQERLEELKIMKGCRWVWPEETDDELDIEVDVAVAKQWWAVKELLDSENDPTVGDLRRQVREIMKGSGEAKNGSKDAS